MVIKSQNRIHSNGSESDKIQVSNTHVKTTKKLFKLEGSCAEM